MRKMRLFGVINPLDVFLVLALAGLIWGLHIFADTQLVEASGGQLIRFTVELNDRPEGFYQTIRPGATVWESVHSHNIGRVVYAFGSPLLDDVPDEDNNIVRRAPVPGREFTYVVVEAWADVTDYATAIGQFHVRVNSPLFVRSYDFAGVSIITHLEFIR